MFKSNDRIKELEKEVKELQILTGCLKDRGSITGIANGMYSYTCPSVQTKLIHLKAENAKLKAIVAELVDYVYRK